MIREERFLMHGDRYLFDNGICSYKQGFAQVDTTQDAWYYGTWTNPDTLQIVQYMEGDYITLTAESVEEYVQYFRDYSQSDYFIGIDTMLNETLKSRFIELGLGELLH